MSHEVRKVCYLTGAELMRLNDACIRIHQAFGLSPYLVGSATRESTYRDVDVRTWLFDDEFDVLFGGKEFFWSLFCLAVSEYLRTATGLPVDYQVQKLSVVQEKFAGEATVSLGHNTRLYAGGGDAT